MNKKSTISGDTLGNTSGDTSGDTLGDTLGDTSGDTPALPSPFASILPEMKSVPLLIKAAHLVPYSLTLDRGQQLQRNGWWLRLIDTEGAMGMGDAAPHPGFGASKPRAVLKDLQRLASHIAHTHMETLEDLRYLVDSCAKTPEGAHAVTLACLDLMSRRRGCSLAKLLSSDPIDRVPCHALVLNGEEALDAVSQGAQHIKFKLTDNLEDNLRRCASIRSHVGDSLGLRLDANARWSRDEAARAIEALAPFKPEWIEQPLPKEDLDGIEWLRERVNVPIALDESVSSPEALREILSRKLAEVVVLKPMFIGGPIKTLEMAQQAIEGGVKVCVTHALESIVGRLGAIHTSAALAKHSQVVAGGLAGAALEGDIARTPNAIHGGIMVPITPGLGLRRPEGF